MTSGYKIYFLILIFVFVTRQSISQVDNKELVRANNYDWYIEQKTDIYKISPSLIHYWGKSDFTMLEFRSSIRNKDFRMFEQGDKYLGYKFDVQSIQSVNDSKLKFYGKFSYDDIKVYNTEWNLFNERDDNKSPFRFVMERIGDWKIKKYIIEGGFSKKLNDKLTIGSVIKYNGEINLRIIDTRNEYYKLDTDIMLSVAYQLKDNIMISPGIGFIHKKSEPQFTNNFKSDGTELYNIYITTGLGDLIRHNIFDPTITTTGNSPKYNLTLFSNNNKDLIISYTFLNDEEVWEYKATNTEESNKFLRYDYILNELHSYFEKNNAVSSYINSAEAILLLGDAYNYRNNNEKTYTVKYVGIKNDLSYLRSNDILFYKNTLSFSYNYLYNKDMKYAQEYSYNNLFIGVKTGMSKLFNKKKLLFDICLNGKKNIENSYKKGVASDKPYTKNIIHNEMAYNNADFLGLGTDIALHVYQRKFTANLSFSYKYREYFINKEEQTYFDNSKRNENCIIMSLNLIF